ncbi:MAG TPA: STAS domain-containing protein [Syntrophales bacterium]|jgi:anti-anti-sigma factor|nr:STAS domain-containing protein [Syntrophales bacterium]HOU52237.1 STAS domain-containing protein [Smithella sp.]HPC33936.1 STAS domain-containing protein [Syntrophales bacterium]HQG35470.1 STAS domain-containing protein [Syntrophales bacterium]HQI36887.1 STAS domain-containing protein [Syntrophales bacterium]
MEINKKREKDVLIVSVKGRIDAVTAPDFEKNLMDFIGAGEKIFLLDMKQLEYISSAGLRSILAIAKVLKTKEGKLVFAGLQGPVKDVFKISGFGSIFNIFDSEAEALTKI